VLVRAENNLELPAFPAILPLLPKDENHRSQADRHPQDGGEIPENPLESAIDFVIGNAGATGEEPFERRRKIAHLQLKALIDWARIHSFFLDQQLWSGIAKIGGSEHDIWENEDRMWKATRPNRFGWTVLPGDDGVPVLSEATPLEYLSRWLDSNRLLGDTVCLGGIHSSDEGTRVIVSQRFLIGRYPTALQIRKELHKFGFWPVHGFSIGSYPDSSFFNPDLNIALFDATTDNFILTMGTPIPIDVIPITVGPKLRNQLLNLMA